MNEGTRCSVVVKALRSGKSRVLDPMSEHISSIHLILSAELGPGVYSAFNRNEHQKQKNNVCRE
jgi:hypothetical protein